MIKVINSENIETKELSRIRIRTPRLVSNGVKRGQVIYLEDGEKKQLCFETDEFKLSHGISRSEKGINFIQIDLDENDPLCIFLEEMDELTMGRTIEHSERWFSFKLDSGVIDQLFLGVVKSSKGKKYVKFGWDKELLELKDSNGKNIHLNEIRKNSNVRIRILFEGVDFYARQIVPVYKLVSLENIIDDIQENKEATNISNYNVDFMQDGSEETELDTQLNRFSKKVEQKEEVIEEEEEQQEEEEEQQEEENLEEEDNLEQQVENISVNEDEEENIEFKEETVPTGNVEGSLEDNDVEEITIDENDTQEEKIRKFSNILGKAVDLLENTNNKLENSITSNASKKSFKIRIEKNKREHTQTM